MPSLAEIEADARVCVACPLAASRTTVVFSGGNAKADLMFVGEAPGHEEDLQGEPFVGRSGKLLDRLIAEELGRDRTGYYICNVVKCRPRATGIHCRLRWRRATTTSTPKWRRWRRR